MPTRLLRSLSASARTGALVGALAMVLAGCVVSKRAPALPEEVCTESCTAKTHGHCSEDECSRGCLFVLDRLLEREGEHVIACVAKETGKKCDDRLFANCAVLVGDYADGGPPAPPKAPD